MIREMSHCLRGVVGLVLLFFFIPIDETLRQIDYRITDFRMTRFRLALIYKFETAIRRIAPVLEGGMPR